MARKKRKEGKSPATASSFPSFSGGRDAWLFPLLGMLGLLAAWLAALGGFADGIVDLRAIFNLDVVQPRLIFRELFLRENNDPWVSTGTAPSYTDFPFQWVMMALGANLAVAIYATILIQAALPAAGWILVCDSLFGKSPLRRMIVLGLHALPLLLTAWRGADLFYSQFIPMAHTGPLMAIPWLLWLSLRFFGPDAANAARRKHRESFPVGIAAAMAALLAIVVASDLFIGPWFVAPAALTALLLAWIGKVDGQRAMQYVGTLAVASVLGRFVLFRLPPLFGVESWQIQYSTDFGVELALETLGRAARHYWHAALRNPAEALVWLAFTFIAVWRTLAVFRPAVRRRTPAALALPEESRHFFAALFVPAVMLCSVIIPSAVGRAGDGFYYLETESGIVSSYLRYSMPTTFLPLFAGWALLPGVSPRRIPFILTGAAALLALSVPKMTRMDFAALDPFNTPFYQCFAENARRLNWRSGIGSLSFSTQFTEVPGANMERMLAAAMHRSSRGGAVFYGGGCRLQSECERGVSICNRKLAQRTGF